MQLVMGVAMKGIWGGVGGAFVSAQKQVLSEMYICLLSAAERACMWLLWNGATKKALAGFMNEEERRETVEQQVTCLK